jgi:stalled ribosome alternative rescue factor ArfA
MVKGEFMNKKGLYANIHAKRERIKKGSGERMRKPGSEGAPTEKDFKDASKTVKEGTGMMEKRLSQGMSVADIAEKHKTSIKAIELQIEKGIKVEKEHTDSETEARTIAMDHLVEIPDYYDRLLAMEKEATNELQEKKKSTVVARDYNAKAMWGRVKKQVFKAKKGKGSYVRKAKYKGMNESKVLTEGASNFSTMEHFPLLVWLDWEQKVDEWMDEAKQFVEEEYADSFNDMMEDEIEQLVQEKFEEISDQSSKDVAVLSEEEFYDLESDKDEFNIKFRNTFDYDSDVVTIEAGYYEGMQLLVQDEEYFKDEDKAMIEEFLYTMKEKYYLTELGGRGAYGLGYTNLGSGKGLNQIELDVEEKEDEDLEEELVPPSKEVVDSFLELLKTNGYNIESIRPDYKELSPEGDVHIQIKSKENKFTEESFEQEYERMSDKIHEFDPTRRYHITYSFGLMNDGYATAGLDIREEFVDSKSMVNLDEASKDFSGKPSKDDLKKAAKRHKKTDKKGARGWFTVLGSGNVQNNINRFNSRVSTGSGPQTSPSSAGYVAPASSGSSGAGSAPAGLGEAVEEQYCLTEKVEKHETLNPKLWEGGKLKSEVADKIFDIVDVFVEGLKENGIKIMIKDIIIIGSNASYNYGDTSDIDVHLVVDTNSFDCPDNLYPFLYSSYRSIFNKKYDIEFYGTGVELFVDTEGTKTISNGIYSLNTGWIKEPVKEEIPELDQEKFDAEFSKWEDMYFKLVKGESDVTNAEKPIGDMLEESLESEKINQIDDFIEDIYDLRKVSLQKDGEYSIGNLVFKEIRSLGYLDNLKVLKNELKSRELSLTEGAIKESFGSKPMQTLEEVDKYAEAILKSIPKDGETDGTYDLDDNEKPIRLDLTSGFQVSFFRDEIREQGNEALRLVLETIGNSFGQQYLGFFGKKPEISYTLELSLAKEVARIFNQESVWDNALQNPEENKSHDKSKKIDYKEAVKELKVLLGKTSK